MWLTGKNCVQYVMAFILVLFAYYGFIFLYRICRELIGLARRDATLLSMAFYTFAYVMVPVMVPDHFSLSMTMLIFTLYVCGKLQQQGRKLGIGQTLLLFVITARHIAQQWHQDLPCGSFHQQEGFLPSSIHPLSRAAALCCDVEGCA